MHQAKHQVGFFFIFIILALVVNYFLFLPYLPVLFMAFVLAIVFDPIYQSIKRTLVSSTLSALVTVFLVLVVIIGPLFLTFMLLFSEAADLSASLLSPHTGAVLNVSLSKLQNALFLKFPGVHFPDLQFDATYLRTGLSWLLSHISVFLAGFAKLAFNLFIMLIALFYFLRDGKHFIGLLADLSPLPNSFDRQIFNRIRDSVSGVIKSNIVTGILQGIVTGAGFVIFGLANPVLWGTVSVVASLIPKLGSFIVIVPAAIYAYVVSGPVIALGLALWGIIFIGTIDNIIGPAITQRAIAVHEFFVLMGALGGLSLFGPIGFIAGPVAVALLLALLDMYPLMTGRKARTVSARSKRKI